MSRGDEIVGTALATLGILGMLFLGSQIGKKLEEEDWKKKIREGRVQDMINVVQAEDAVKAAQKKLVESR